MHLAGSASNCDSLKRPTCDKDVCRLMTKDEQQRALEAKGMDVAEQERPTDWHRGIGQHVDKSLGAGKEQEGSEGLTWT